MQEHFDAGGQRNNDLSMASKRLRRSAQTPSFGFPSKLMVFFAAVIFFGAFSAARAEAPVLDNFSATGRSDVTSENKSTPSGNAATPPSNEETQKDSSAKKKKNGTQTTAHTPHGYGPSTAVDQSKYLKALKLERDVGQHMRTIDNALRQMNTDINRIRTLERRF